jgi:hypothetical protein
MAIKVNTNNKLAARIFCRTRNPLNESNMLMYINGYIRIPDAVLLVYERYKACEKYPYTTIGIKYINEYPEKNCPIIPI